VKRLRAERTPPTWKVPAGVGTSGSKTKVNCAGVMFCAMAVSGLAPTGCAVVRSTIPAVEICTRAPPVSVVSRSPPRVVSRSMATSAASRLKTTESPGSTGV
jgi:hypothetical protein